MTATVPTIAAIATANGAAGVGVVRVSGPGVPAMAAAILGKAPRPRHAHFVAFRDTGGALIDRGLLLYFPAPASYTGEHVLELQGHGSPVVLDLLLRQACTMGARLARPGEFTERAFLNGKLDLVQAEAVADLIAARSATAARAALQSMEGVFSARVDDLLAGLVALRVHVEAAIDFPEEEIDFLADPAIGRQLDALRDTLATLLDAARRGVRLTDGIRVAIVGRPNAGKSSLLNALAGTDRAIVTDRAGTTRDVVHAAVSIDGVTIELADTAGLRDTDDPVEREGVRRTHGELATADVALLVTDALHRADDMALVASLPDAVARVVVINKIDVHPWGDAAPGCVALSAKTGEGLERLRVALRLLATGREQEGAFSARRRHVMALEAVAASLAHADTCLRVARAGELVAEELRQAQQQLGEITGSYSADDLLGAIFGSFCIGK
jgi:tRNA modification GTPase